MTKYRILEDLTYQGKPLTVGTTSDLSSLYKEEIQSLKERKIIIEAALWTPDASDIDIIVETQKKADDIIDTTEKKAEEIVNAAIKKAKEIEGSAKQGK